MQLKRFTADKIRQKSKFFYTFCKILSVIIPLTMQVYVELALLENFCMDFTLLYCAKLVSKNGAHILRVAAASVLGACFAVLFPLVKLNAVFSVIIKLISGLIICAVSGKYATFKAYLKLTGIFFAFSFLLAGGLYAIFSLTGLKYIEGQGFLLSSVPIGIPLFCALVLIIFARKLALKFKKTDKSAVVCKIYCGDKSVSLSGFFDSGNKVYHMGQPVSVIPLRFAKKIIDESRIKDFVKIHTVAGEKKIKIFTADKIEISGGERTTCAKKVKIAISYRPMGGAVLHPDLSEV